MARITNTLKVDMPTTPRDCALYRAALSCKVGRDVLEGIHKPPSGVSVQEYALFNLLHAVEEIASAMKGDKP